MKVTTINYIPNIYFKGCTSSATCPSRTNELGTCCLETHFMRDVDSLEFTSNYIKNNFPNGTNIANYACSRGYEAYSLATLLKNSNADKKYKITGYDLIQEAVTDAKTAIFNIGQSSNLNENYLTSVWATKTQKQKEIKALFDECFEKMPDKWRQFNIYDHRYKHKAERVNPSGQDINLTIKRLEYIHLPGDRTDDRGCYYIPKKGVFDNVIDFKIGDIMNIDNDLANQKTGVVTFKNALYHIIGRDVDTYNLNLERAETLFKKINSVLPTNGLFLLGSLHSDHYFDPFRIQEKDIIIKNQDGNFVKTYDKTIIHDLLYAAGFEPAFYDKHQTAFTKGHDLIEIYLPSVWKKVKNII